MRSRTPTALAARGSRHLRLRRAHRRQFAGNSCSACRASTFRWSRVFALVVHRRVLQLLHSRRHRRRCGEDLLPAQGNTRPKDAGAALGARRSGHRARFLGRARRRVHRVRSGRGSSSAPDTRQLRLDRARDPRGQLRCRGILVPSSSPDSARPQAARALSRPRQARRTRARLQSLRPRLASHARAHSSSRSSRTSATSRSSTARLAHCAARHAPADALANLSPSCRSSTRSPRMPISVGGVGVREGLVSRSSSASLRCQRSRGGGHLLDRLSAHACLGPARRADLPLLPPVRTRAPARDPRGSRRRSEHAVAEEEDRDGTLERRKRSANGNAHDQPHRRTRPFVTANFALTWDARISTRNGTPADFSSKRDKRRLARNPRDRRRRPRQREDHRRRQYDAWACPTEDLRARAARARPGEYPLRVLLTASGRIDPSLRVFREDFSPIVIFSTTRMPAHTRRALAAKADLWLHDPATRRSAACCATLADAITA